MAAILELLKKNQHDLHVVQHDQTVIEAVHFIVENNVGAVPVLNNGELVGIFSERDIMTRIMVRGLDPHITCVATVMSPDPFLKVEPDTSFHNMHGADEAAQVPPPPADMPRQSTGRFSLPARPSLTRG